VKKPPKFRHPEAPSARKRKTSERGLGWDWQKFRKSQIELKGAHCARCWEKYGIVTPGRQLHHIVPRRQDMSLRKDPANVRFLCIPCHKIEDQQDGS